MSIDLGTINSGSDFAAKTPNTFPLATSDFLGNPLNVLNISSGFSFRYLKLQHQVIAWQQYVQGSIPTLLAAQMSCALGSDGQLKDASAIDWYNDPDDDTPMLPPPPPPASNGKLTTFVSRRSGRAVKPTEKIRDAANAAPAKRVAPAPPQGQPAPKRVVRRRDDDDDDNDDEPPALEDCSDDEEEAEDNDKEEAYERTKAFGDKDREDRKHKGKEERSRDLKVVFTQEKGCINPHTQEREDGWWCEICRANNVPANQSFFKGSVSTRRTHIARNAKCHFPIYRDRCNERGIKMHDVALNFFLKLILLRSDVRTCSELELNVCERVHKGPVQRSLSLPEPDPRFGSRFDKTPSRTGPNRTAAALADFSQKGIRVRKTFSFRP